MPTSEHTCHRFLYLQSAHARKNGAIENMRAITLHDWIEGGGCFSPTRWGQCCVCLVNLQ
jgi:hypothetical protein